jgi:hypothetical protein
LGDGDRLDDCRLFGTGRADATIHVWVRDADGTELYNVPATDIYVVTCVQCPQPDPNGADPPNPIGPAIVCCTGGCAADASTDLSGHTQFSNELAAGCCGCEVRVYINGSALAQDCCPEYHFNSPDLNCDGQVNLSDVVVFSQWYFSDYSYCADFYWDGPRPTGPYNLSDIVVLAQHVGHACP